MFFVTARADRAADDRGAVRGRPRPGAAHQGRAAAQRDQRDVPGQDRPHPAAASGSPSRSSPRPSTAWSTWPPQAMSTLVGSGVMRHGERRRRPRSPPPKKRKENAQGGPGPAHPGARRRGRHRCWSSRWRCRTCSGASSTAAAQSLMTPTCASAADADIAEARSRCSGEGAEPRPDRAGRCSAPAVLVVGVAGAARPGRLLRRHQGGQAEVVASSTRSRAFKRIFGPQALWEGAKMLLKTRRRRRSLVWTHDQGRDAADRRPGADAGRARPRPRPARWR